MVLEHQTQDQQCQNNLRAFCRGGKKTSLPNLPSKSSRVTVPSTYSHQCFPSVETGISQLDHLQARWIQTQATTGGVYCRLKVVRCRLTSPGEKTKSHQLPRLSCRSTREMGGTRPSGPPQNEPWAQPAPSCSSTARLCDRFACSGLLCYREFGFSSTTFCYRGNLGASLRGKATGDLPDPPVL